MDVYLVEQKTFATWTTDMASSCHPWRCLCRGPFFLSCYGRPQLMNGLALATTGVWTDSIRSISWSLYARQTLQPQPRPAELESTFWQAPRMTCGHTAVCEAWLATAPVFWLTRRCEWISVLLNLDYRLEALGKNLKKYMSPILIWWRIWFNLSRLGPRSNSSL